MGPDRVFYTLTRCPSIGTVGFIFQNIAFAITIPTYFLIHLLTSPVAKAFTPPASSNVLLVPANDLAVLPYSITLGYVIPSLLMALPAPAVVSQNTHQVFIAFWQAFPVWTMIAHYTLAFSNSTTAITVASSPAKEANSTPQSAYLRSARHVYNFAFGLCIATHLPVVIPAILPGLVPVFLPFLNGKSSGFPSLSSIFLPPSPFGHQATTHSLAAGVHIFLQWDLYVGSTACLVWAVLLHRNSAVSKMPSSPLPRHTSFAEAETMRQRSGWLTVLQKVAMWTVLAGPVGAVTMLLRERDEVVKQKVTDRS